MAGNVCCGKFISVAHAVLKFDDAALVSAIREHRKEEFWLNVQGHPSHRAALRRWGSYLRREGYRRGLEF